MGRLEGQILAYMHGVRQVRGLLMHGSKVDHRVVQLDQLRQPAHGNRRVSKGGDLRVRRGVATGRLQ